MRVRIAIVVVGIVIGNMAFSSAQPGTKGSVELSGDTEVSPSPSLPKLKLTNEQRE
jgi:hypothetical protein